MEIVEDPLSCLGALTLLGIKDVKRVVAAKVNGILMDLSASIENDSEIEPVFIDSEEGLDILRHSTSHVMAMAVKEIFPGVKVTIGPAIENGFYYDFDYKRPFKEEDLPLIEKKMEEIILKLVDIKKS